MDIKVLIFENVLTFALLVIIIYFLKYRNFLKETDGNIFSKLLIDIVLPCVIFYQVASHVVNRQQLILIAVMF